MNTVKPPNIHDINPLFTLSMVAFPTMIPMKSPMEITHGNHPISEPTKKATKSLQETHSLTKFVLVPGGRTYMSETLRTWVMPLGLASQAAIKHLTRLGGIVKWYRWYHGGTAFWTNPSIEAGGLDKMCCHRLFEIKTLTERSLKCVPHLKHRDDKGMCFDFTIFRVKAWSRWWFPGPSAEQTMPFSGHVHLVHLPSRAN